MVNESEKARQLNWDSIEKRLNNYKTISNSFKEELRQIFTETIDFLESDFEPFSLEEVFTYLKASHVAYLEITLPKIENTLHQLCVTCC